jgi:hypothetical protein
MDIPFQRLPKSHTSSLVYPTGVLLFQSVVCRKSPTFLQARITSIQVVEKTEQM